jgi:hypothetical protein
MPVTVQLHPELERRLRREAARHGLDPEAYVARALEEHLRNSDPHGGNGAAGSKNVSERESDLLQRINLGLPPERWEQYRQLISKRDDATLSPAEQQTLVGISDQIEAANARRMGYLVELANLRGVGLAAVMKDLGITGGSRG